MEENQPALSRPKPLTSLDVARRAGVSRTAVSYVLNGIETAHVSAETRAKVLRAAQELGYHLNASAQALRKGQSNEICIFSNVAMATNDAEILTAMQQHALRLGYMPVIYFIGGLDAEKRRELLIRVLSRRPLALVLAPDTIQAEEIELARQMGVEYIFLGTAEPVEEHQLNPAILAETLAVSIPTRAIGYLAAQHLLARGHRSLGIVRPAETRHELAFLQRLQGMHEAMADSGLDESEVTLTILPLQLSLAAASELVETFLRGPQRPTAIYTFNDEYALPLMGALHDHKLRVPQDIALLGTDNAAFSAFVRPALTTISYDNLALGQRSIEMLAALQKGQPLPAELTRPLDLELIVRASS